MEHATRKAPSFVTCWILLAAACLAAAAPASRYPGFMAERIVVLEAAPSFRTVASPDGIRYVWLDLKGKWGVIWLSWDQKGVPAQAAPGQLPFLARRLTLDPAVRYTFELFGYAPCDTVSVRYPYAFGEWILLRVLRGSEVVFDSGATFSEKARGSELPPGVAPAAPEDAVVAPLASLLERWIAGGATEGWLQAVRKEAERLRQAAVGGIPAVLSQQPPYDNAVAVLVFDPQARGRKRVAATVFEGICSDDLNRFNPPAWLDEAGGASGIFVGRAPVEGSHSTLVQVRYRRKPGNGRGAVYASGLSSMAFH